MQGLHTLKCPLPLPPVVGCLEHEQPLHPNSLVGLEHVFGTGIH